MPHGHGDPRYNIQEHDRHQPTDGGGEEADDGLGGGSDIAAGHGGGNGQTKQKICLSDYRRLSLGQRRCAGKFFERGRLIRLHGSEIPSTSMISEADWLTAPEP